jgi:hypothetical protein
MTKVSQSKCVYLLESFCTEFIGIYENEDAVIWQVKIVRQTKLVVVVLFCQGFQATLNPDAKLMERGVVCLTNSTRFVAQQVALLEKVIEGVPARLHSPG